MKKPALCNLALVLFAALQFPAFAASVTITDAELQKILEQSKILKSDYRLTVAAAGTEAIISTYANSESTDLDKDCKIDAVLLSQKCFQSDAALAKVKVRFYDFAKTGYRQVLVTAGDVIAFGSGTIAQDKLLDSLEIVLVSTKPAEPKTAATTTSSAQTANAHPDMLLYQAGGIGFYCPKTWTQNTHPEEGVLLHLVSTQTDDYAEIYLTIDRRSASITAAVDGDNSEAKSRPMSKFEWSGARKIGYGSKIDAFDVCFDHANDNRQVIVERRVYFGSPHNVLRLSLECRGHEFAAFSKDFGKVLATVYSTGKVK